VKTLVRYLGWFMIGTIGVFVLSRFGEVVQENTPVALQQPLLITGVLLFCGAMVCLALFKVPPMTIGVRTWRMSMGVGAVAGVILFLFYVSDIECRTTPRGAVSCNYKGSTN